jgi:hypothetical protein
MAGISALAARLNNGSDFGGIQSLNIAGLDEAKCTKDVAVTASKVFQAHQHTL